MLDLAVSLWRNVSQYQITAAQAISGNHPLKNVSFSGACNSGVLPSLWPSKRSIDAVVQPALPALSFRQVFRAEDIFSTVLTIYSQNTVSNDLGFDQTTR
jgi:hypothetical protein